MVARRKLLLSRYHSNLGDQIGTLFSFSFSSAFSISFFYPYLPPSPPPTLPLFPVFHIGVRSSFDPLLSPSTWVYFGTCGGQGFHSLHFRSGSTTFFLLLVRRRAVRMKMRMMKMMARMIPEMMPIRSSSTPLP